MSIEDPDELDATFRGTADPVPESPDPDDITVHDDADVPIQHPAAVRRGQTIGRYVVVDKIGSGSMGVVYRAYDPDLDRKIALKLVEVRRRRGRDIEARLLREAQAIARVSHPNVIAVYDVGIVELGVFVAMEYVEGQTLKQWVRSAKRSPGEVVALFIQAAHGLAAAHEAGIVHRDFKPDNVMISIDGRVRVLDFGLARALGGGSTEHPLDPGEVPPLLEGKASPSLDASLTRDGIVVGTPAYMAPEQHLGGTAGPASDQFSFCVALWEALYGERPFGGDTHAVVAFNMTRGNIRPPSSKRAVPRWLQQVVTRGLSVEVEARHSSMSVLAEELEIDPTSSRRQQLAAGGAISLVLLGALVAAGITYEQRSMCGSARGQVDELWNEDRRTAIGKAFAASAYPFATESWERTEASLDQWSERWVTSRVEACEATRVHGEQSEALLDLRMACLDRHLEELSALLNLFDEPDREVVIGAVDAVYDLGDLDECADAVALRRTQPRLEDPADVARAKQLEEALQPIEARVRAGSLKDLGPQIAALQPEVEALNHPPLSERYWSLRGEIEQTTGQTPAARESWEQAFRQALAGDQRARATWIAGRLTYVVGFSLALERDGKFWSDTAMVLLDTIEDDGRTLASIRSAQGSMWHAMGKLDRSLELGEQVLAYWSEQAPDGPAMAQTLGNLGALHRTLGNYDEAIDLHRRALERIERLYGEHHPEAAKAHHGLGLSLSFAGRNEEALPQLQRALDLVRSAYGEQNTDVATNLDTLGRVLRRLGRFDEAEQRHREAYEIWRAEFGDEHPDVAVSLMNIGYTLVAKDDHRGALEVLQRATQINRGALGPDHPSLVYAGAAIAQVHLLLDDPVHAQNVARETLALGATAQVDPTLVAELQFVLAQALVAARGADAADRARAIELAKEARATYEPKAKHWQAELDEIGAWLDQHE